MGAKGDFELVAPPRASSPSRRSPWSTRWPPGTRPRRWRPAYLQFLYTPQGQEIAARHYYRPRNANVVAKYGAQFPKLKLFTIDQTFGGWAKAQKTHFDDGGLFDQIYGAGK